MDPDILRIINNQCRICRPASRYIFTVETLDGRLVCMSMDPLAAIAGALKKIDEVRKMAGTSSGNWLRSEDWDEFLAH